MQANGRDALRSAVTSAADRIRLGVSILVSLVWSISVIIAAVTQNFLGLGIITPVMMLVCTFLLGYKKEDIKINADGRSDDLSDW